MKRELRLKKQNKRIIIWFVFFLIAIILFGLKNQAKIMGMIDHKFGRHGEVCPSISVTATLDVEEYVVRGMEYAHKERLQYEEEKQQENDELERYLEECINEMTLEQKLAQMMILTNEKDICVEAFSNLQPGGILLFAADFSGKTVADVSKRVANLQSVCEYPLLVGVDEEGGSVSRVCGLMGEGDFFFEGARQLGESGDEKYIQKATKRKMKLLKKLGINLNFDPVADIVSDSKAYMYERSAGSDDRQVSTYVKNVVQVMKKKNIISCLKHFPGYGNNTNTHLYFAKDEKKLKKYKKSDFKPFLTGVENGADMIMVSHIVMQRVDNQMPASLSLPVHQLIREQLKFDGVVIADDLNMRAILDQMSLKAASGKAIEAGNDMIFSADFKKSLKGMKKSVKAGRVTQSQIDESVKRILKMKYEHKMIRLEANRE